MSFHLAQEASVAWGFHGNKAQKLYLHLWVPSKHGCRLDLLTGWRGGGVVVGKGAVPHIGLCCCLK